jgi:hypothetical protein
MTVSVNSVNELCFLCKNTVLRYDYDATRVHSRSIAKHEQFGLVL